MKIVNLNVLLYAVNRDAPQHRIAREFWEAAINGEEPIGLAWMVVLGFLRLSTRPGVFASPLTAEQAIECIKGWVSNANTTIAAETDDHWRVLRGLMEGAGTAGNLTTDAHLAALAICRGAVLFSFDADFSRFTRLRWETHLRT